MGLCHSNQVAQQEVVEPTVIVAGLGSITTIHEDTNQEGHHQGHEARTRKKNIPKSLKRAVWDNTFGASVGHAPCWCCERAYIRQIEFHCGHIIAEASGGQTTLDNLRPICAQCNLSMGTQNMLEFKRLFQS